MEQQKSSEERANKFKQGYKLHIAVYMYSLNLLTCKGTVELLIDNMYVIK